MNGAATLAWSSDQSILERAEHGGVVTTLFRFALESGRVDAVRFEALVERGREERPEDPAAASPRG